MNKSVYEFIPGVGWFVSRHYEHRDGGEITTVSAVASPPAPIIHQAMAGLEGIRMVPHPRPTWQNERH